MPEINTPVMRYKHECRECKALGAMGEYDLYYCEQMGMSTVIARFGNSGHEYLSGLNSEIPVLRIAKTMAVELGHIKERVA